MLHEVAVNKTRLTSERIDCAIFINASYLKDNGSGKRGLLLPNFGKTVFPKLNPQDIKALPVRQIDFSKTADKSRHDRLVGLVDKLLVLMLKLRAAKTESEKTVLQNAATATDQQIDALVHDLYGLTVDEINLVQNAA